MVLKGWLLYTIVLCQLGVGLWGETAKGMYILHTLGGGPIQSWLVGV